MSAPVHVAFAFASRGIGGAERSMLRLMARAHPDPFDCRVIVPAPENAALRRAVAQIGVPYHALAPFDLPGLVRLLRSARPDVLYVFGRFRTVPWALAARLAGVHCVVAAERSAANRWSDRMARRLDRALVTAYVANSEFAARNLREIVGERAPGLGRAERRQRRSPASPVRARDAGPLAAVRREHHAQQGPGRAAGGDPSPAGPLTRGSARRSSGRTSRTAASSARPRRGAFATRTPPSASSTTCAPTWHEPTPLVLPTLHREGMPTALLEAMRAGVPVVASRVGGVSEIVEHGRTGILVTPGDAQGLASAIARLLDDEGARPPHGRRGPELRARAPRGAGDGRGASRGARGRPAPRPPRAPRHGRPRDDGGALASLPAPVPAVRAARPRVRGHRRLRLRERTCRRSRRAGSRTGPCR